MKRFGLAASPHIHMSAKEFKKVRLVISYRLKLNWDIVVGPRLSVSSKIHMIGAMHC